jgi:hypothetical protein
MATTPTYSWPLPDDTDLVKDGAEAIRDLGNAIDTTVSGLGSGLVHINTTTFTGSSSESFNGVFSAEYDNYRLVYQVLHSSGSVQVRVRLRASGADNSDNIYTTRTLLAQSTTVSTSSALSTAGDLFVATSNDVNNGSIDIYRPFLGPRTQFLNFSKSDNDIRFTMIDHAKTLLVSYDGFSLIPASGTISGIIRVYGYKN